MKLKNNVSFESIIRSFEELYNRSYNTLELAELKLCYDNQLPLGITSHINNKQSPLLSAFLQ